MIDTPLPLIVEPDMLQALMPDENLLLVAVCGAQVYDSYHIPDSHLIEPAELVSGIKPATGKIAPAERLSALFSRIGLSADKQVVAYDDEGGGWAGRLIWTLDVIGHGKASYLNGGLVAWFKAGYPLTSSRTPANPTDYEAAIDHSQIASLDDVLAQINDPDSIVWDARAPQEYAGTRITALRNGHIPGAVNLDWLELMDRERDLRLKPLEEIAAALGALGIDDSKAVITHCQTHHRSGLSYLVGKALGMNIRAYDGSWSEWGNLDGTPIERAGDS